MSGVFHYFLLSSLAISSGRKKIQNQSYHSGHKIRTMKNIITKRKEAYYLCEMRENAGDQLIIGFNFCILLVEKVAQIFSTNCCELKVLSFS